MALANTGKIRPSVVVFIVRFGAQQVFPPRGASEVGVRDGIENHVGTDNGEMIVDSFAFGAVPFQETDEGATSAQVRCEFGAGDADESFGHGVGVIGDDDETAVPSDPIEISDRTLHIQTAAVQTNGLSDRAAPVVGARHPEEETTGDPVTRDGPGATGPAS